MFYEMRWKFGLKDKNSLVKHPLKINPRSENQSLFFQVRLKLWPLGFPRYGSFTGMCLKKARITKINPKFTIFSHLDVSSESNLHFKEILKYWVVHRDPLMMRFVVIPIYLGFSPMRQPANSGNKSMKKTLVPLNHQTHHDEAIF